MTAPPPAPARAGARAGARSQIVAGLAFFVLGAVALITGRNLDIGTLNHPGPGFFPLSLAVLLVVVGAAIAFRAGAGASAGSEPWPDRTGGLRVVMTFAALAALALLVEWLGFVACSATATFVMLRFVGGRSGIRSALFSIALSAGLYLLFVRWLGVTLPVGTLFG